ncbi:hypothetical protein [Noviherbaspirillum aridicola]|uniref:Uncharacterized protein n=1 Tax=Noviherbaspirillum aridicola TaxID=2849687 RepID=A0ABQ4Q536_9BURK|nr:hypothetical protein [Noviherbaspirillum aridicola]GIZ52306.1 hypothetical protein NCCP691_23200 [Noviherbaspirillum aridicola]
MANPVIRAYDTLEAAQAARQALLDGGFDPDGIEVRVMQTESGPVKNNFLLDEKDTGTGPKDEFGLEERTDAYGNGSPEWGANVLLTVAAGDDGQARRADEIMSGFGAVDPQTRSDAARPGRPAAGRY